MVTCPPTWVQSSKLKHQLWFPEFVESKCRDKCRVSIIRTRRNAWNSRGGMHDSRPVTFCPTKDDHCYMVGALSESAECDTETYSTSDVCSLSNGANFHRIRSIHLAMIWICRRDIRRFASHLHNERKCRWVMWIAGHPIETQQNKHRPCFFVSPHLHRFA